MRKIRVIPTELRRFSSIRAANQTFEYVGFGHGNYSVALPQRQTRTLDKKDQIIAQAKQSDGGAVVYTGMNDSGDFYLGNKRIGSVNGEEETINAAIQTYLGDEISNLSVSFDDVTIRNTLIVDGGPGNLQSSEFKGPVNFSNKVSITSPDGLELESINLKGNLSQPRNITERLSIPTYAPNNQGDITFFGNPTNGGYLGWVSVGSAADSWRRFGLISRSSTSMYVTPDKIGINTSGTLRSLINSPGSPEALLDVRGGAVFDEIRVIGNVDFVNGATFASVSFVDLNVSGITTLSGSVRILGTTDSTNPVTGILTVAGGVGIAKNLNVGAGLSVTGISTFASNVFMNGNVGVLGNAGIGTTNPAYKLDVLGDVNFTGTLRQNGTQFVASRWTAGSGDDIYRLSGDVGIGTTNPAYALDVLGDINFTGTFRQNGSQFVASRWTSGSGNDIYRLDGDVGIGTANPQYKLEVLGGVYVTGVLTCTQLQTTSDLNLKENIQTIENPLDKVLKINGVTFDWKENHEPSVGVIAQEVEKILPQAVTEVNGTKSINYNGLIGLLIEAIKDQQKQIDELKNKVG
jgi:hypothetical protein